MNSCFADPIPRHHLRTRQVRLSIARQVRSTVRKGTTAQRVPVTRRVLRLSARNLQVCSSLSHLRQFRNVLTARFIWFHTLINSHLLNDTSKIKVSTLNFCTINMCKHYIKSTADQ